MNAQVKKVLDTLPSYMVAEWALPALINGDYTGILDPEDPDSCGEAVLVSQFDETVVNGRSIIVDEEADGTINPVFAKDEITGTFAECARIWLA